MKELYEKPDMSVLQLEVEDVITNSNYNVNDDQLPEFDVPQS